MKRLMVVLAALFMLSGCAEVELASHVLKKSQPAPSQGTFKVGTPYKIAGKKYYPKESYDLVETGIASWYGPNFHGKKTANGEVFDQNELTAAHRTLQMPSLVRVTNLDNGRSLIVRVNDRGPYKKGRVIDLSKRAAELLEFKNQGTAKVKLEVLKQESLKIAEAAKKGLDTNGYEVALNRGGSEAPGTPRKPITQVQVAQANPYPAEYPPSYNPQGYPADYPTGAYQIASTEPAAGAPAAVDREIIPSGEPAGMRAVVPGTIKAGNFYPDPIVSEMPVTRSNIFVQVGSFSVYENAMKHKQTMQQFAQADIYPANVNGQNFYRVRLGPIASVDQADGLLDRVISSGQGNAIIVVE